MIKSRWIKTIMIGSALVAALAFAGLVLAAGHQTIVETAAEDGRFDTAVAGIKAAGLEDELSGGEWTIFIPTDEAFAKLGLNANNIASGFTKEELADNVLYHTMDSRKDTSALIGMVGDITMTNGKLAGLKVFEDDLYVNDDSKVIIPNIIASNGVIHVVDTVILPPWPHTDQVSENPALWWWGEPAGTGKVVRTQSGVTGELDTSVADLWGKAMTLWIVVFNNPDACTTGPGVPKCTDKDAFTAPGVINEAVQPDFLYADGHVTDGGNEDFVGYVQRNGEEGLYGTGLGELICRINTDVLGAETCDPADINTPGLQNPESAEIHLVLHDHGMAMTGQDLEAQTTSFLGGCPGLPTPFPENADDLQDCQSIQFSVHQVP
jgi:uncharacterized surface protein with fasciclin (FAS1) repeats